MGVLYTILKIARLNVRTYGNVILKYKFNITGHPIFDSKCNQKAQIKYYYAYNDYYYLYKVTNYVLH